MENLSGFCSCKNTNCPLHPTKHNKGCAPCIAKNLKLHEVPNCFFDLLKDGNLRDGDSFEDFANAVLKNQ